MSSLPCRADFDSAICWFISLGYYSEEFDRTFLREVRRCLRPHGTLVIEAVNPVGMLRVRADELGGFIEETWLQDDLMSLHLTYDPVTGQNEVERFVVRGGVVRRSTFSVRLYSAPELRRMLEDCGYRVQRIVNNEEAPLTVNDERMYIVAERQCSIAEHR